MTVVFVSENGQKETFSTSVFSYFQRRFEALPHQFLSVGGHFSRRVYNYAFHDRVMYNKMGFAARRLLLAAAQLKATDDRALDVFFFSYDATISQRMTPHFVCEMT